MDYKIVTDTIDTTTASYAAVVTKTEKKLLEKALTEAKALDTDPEGKIKFSLANLRRLGTIKSALAKAASNKEYLKGVSDLASAIGQIEAEQIQYYSTAFGVKSISDSFKDKADYVKKLAVKNTIDGLTGAGLDAGVLNGINTLLMKAVTTSSSYKDLTDQLYKTLSSGNGQTSTFARYANTYAATAMTQYAGQNNKMFTDDLDIKWFRYVGSNIETTRAFCEALTAKEWIYITEIPDILAGKIDQNGTIKTLPLNPKTNLPYGLIDGTTPDNFMVNVGGWNCRHQLVPVAAAAVPQNIRDRFEKNNHQLIQQVKKTKKRKTVSQANTTQTQSIRQTKNYDPSITPTELLAGSSWWNGRNIMIDSRIFRMLNHSIAINITTKGGSFESGGISVTLANTNRTKNSEYCNISVVYHEIGHAVVDQKKLYSDSALLNLRKKWKDYYNKKIDAIIEEKNYDYVSKKWTTKKVAGKYSRAYLLDRKIKELASDFYRLSDAECMAKYGLKKWDAIEQLSKLADTLMSLNPRYGSGHTISYWKELYAKEHEYLAHCFENYFIDNKVFELLSPDMYQEMKDYIQSII